MLKKRCKYGNITLIKYAVVTKMVREIKTNCESCVNYVLDEEYGEYYCKIDLDEDEMERYAAGRYRSCPHYRFFDEYLSVRKQN